MATKFCAWTGVRTRGASSAPRRCGGETTPSVSVTVGGIHDHISRLIRSLLWAQTSIYSLRILAIISALCLLLQDGKVIVWDAFTTNKVLGVSFFTVHVHNPWVYMNIMFCYIHTCIVFLGACGDDALHLGNGLCLRTLWLCGRLWVSG